MGRVRWVRWAVVPVAAAASLLLGAGTPALAATGGLLPDTVHDDHTHNVLPGLARARDLGPADPRTPMRLVVTLDRPDPAGERTLLAQLHAPGHRGGFLTPQQFADRFGVPAARRDAATGWLRRDGLTVVSVSRAGDQITATGPADSVARAFGTPIHAFDSAQGRFLADTSDPRVPAGLGVRNIVGLNTAQRMRPLPRPKPATHQTGCTGGICTGGTTPADLWSVYQQPSSVTGKGQRVAIFGAGATDGVIKDLRGFEDRFRLPHTDVRVHHPRGGGRYTDDSGHEEWNIDTQAANGMAPDLSGLDLYFGDSLADAEVNRLFSDYADDPDAPRQATASFGECEAAPVVSRVARLPLLNVPLPVDQGLGNDLDASLTPITRQAALEGRTIFASSGDTGSSCPVVALPVIGAGNGVLNQAVPLTDSPATLPDVVAVGGTVLYTDGHGHRAREYAWPFSGGGSAQFIPAPDYQRGTPGLTLPCVVPAGVPCRGVPDVAAQSGDVAGNGYDIVSHGRYLAGGAGGTSLSSPLWAGMWARIQSASSAPGGLGFAGYPLYRLGKDPAGYHRDFDDVSSTDTAHGAPSANGLYPSTPGWDYVTGFGTPRVAGLIQDLTGRNGA
jgi:pseudomonalisin